MKKLMFVAAAAASLVAVADVTSANIVGYVGNDMSGTTYKAFGSAFSSVGADGTFTLKDVKPEGDYSCDDDLIYLVNSETCEADNTIVYYNEKQGAKLGGAGWYDAFEDTPFNDEEFAIGTGFQTSFTGNEFSFVSSGQVDEDGYSVDCTDKVYQFLVNATSRTITWKEISVGGDYSCDDDLIYLVNPETCEADNTLVYYNEKQGAKLGGAGWYDAFEDTAFNDEEILPGEGFQTSFTGNEVYINFPGLN